MRSIGDDGEDVLQDVRQVGLVEAGRGLLVLLDVDQQPVQNLETGVSDITHRVLERPDDAVEHQLELGRRYAEEGGEAVRVDRLQEQEKVRPVLRVLLEVLVDHGQGAFEYRVEYFRYLKQCGQMPN